MILMLPCAPTVDCSTSTRASGPPDLATIPSVQLTITLRRTVVVPWKTLMPLASSAGFDQSRIMVPSTVTSEPNVSRPSSSPPARTQSASTAA